jgi:hypothetical protein
MQDLVDYIYQEHVNSGEQHKEQTHDQGCYIKRSRKTRLKKNNINRMVLRSTYKRTTRLRKSTQKLSDFLY